MAEGVRGVARAVVAMAAAVKAAARAAARAAVARAVAGRAAQRVEGTVAARAVAAMEVGVMAVVVSVRVGAVRARVAPRRRAGWSPRRAHPGQGGVVQRARNPRPPAIPCHRGPLHGCLYGASNIPTNQVTSPYAAQ